MAIHTLLDSHVVNPIHIILKVSWFIFLAEMKQKYHWWVIDGSIAPPFHV